MVNSRVIHPDKHSINSQEKPLEGMALIYSKGLKLHDHEVHPQTELLLKTESALWLSVALYLYELLVGTTFNLSDSPSNVPL